MAGAAAPRRAAAGGGGGGPVVGSDGERVGEHRWRSRKLATGSFGCEGGWRRGLRGGLGGGAAMVLATAVPGQQGQRSSVLALRKEGEKDGDASELAGKV